MHGSGPHGRGRGPSSRERSEGRRSMHGSLNEGRRGAPATTWALETTQWSRDDAQRRPEGCSGYNQERPFVGLGDGARSTKAGGVLRLQPGTAIRRPRRRCALNEGLRGAPATTTPHRARRTWTASLNEGRRGAPATTDLRGRIEHGAVARSTKAGGVLRLQPSGQAGRDPSAARSTKAGGVLRLQPVHQPQDHVVACERSTKAVSFHSLTWSEHAQRRPEGCSGYNRPDRPRSLIMAQRSTKAGGVLRLQQHHPTPEKGTIIIAQRRPEGCSGYNRGRNPLGSAAVRRSTKAGGVLRLQRSAHTTTEPPHASAQRRRRGAPATTGQAPRSGLPHEPVRSTKAGGVLRLQLWPRRRGCPTRPALNEGRRGAPATTAGRAARADPVDPAQRKAGGVLRLQPGMCPQVWPPIGALNEGRRGAPATTAPATEGPIQAVSAQRRPEGCSGYNGSESVPAASWGTPLNEGRRGAPATTPDERAGGNRLSHRSTKAGGVLRLQLGEYAPTNASLATAQRRPEGCSGYNSASGTPPRAAGGPLNEGRRGAPATT